MHPILFKIPLPHWKLPERFGGDYLPAAFPIYAYGVMLGLSLVVGWYISLTLAKRDGLPREAMANNYVFTAISAIIGARVLYIVTNLDEFHKFGDYLSIRSGGLVAYGGFLGGFIGSWWYCRVKRIRLLAWADAAVPSLASGIMLTRIGCYLFGCDFGKKLPESAPGWLKKLGTFPEWHYDHKAAQFLDDAGLRAAYENGAKPVLLSGSPAWAQQTTTDPVVRDLHHSLPVNPTQIYESLCGLFLLLVLFAARRSIKQRQAEGKPFFRGELFLVFTFGYGVLRFLLEIVRDDAERGSYGPYFEPQIGYAASLMIMALAFVIGISAIIRDERLQTLGRVVAILVPVGVFIALKPGNRFDLVEKVQLSTSQIIALITGTAAALYYRRGLDLAIADPEVAADLGEGVPALLEEEAAFERDPSGRSDTTDDEKVTPPDDDRDDKTTVRERRERSEKATVHDLPAQKGEIAREEASEASAPNDAIVEPKARRDDLIAMLGLSFGEIILVLIVFGIVFGWGLLPRIGENIGGFFDGVKKGTREDDARIVVRERPKDDKP